MPVIINVTKSTIALISHFPTDILAPASVDEITDGNLTNVDININLIGFIGNKPPKYTIKSFGVPGMKNNIQTKISIVLVFLNNLLFSILSILFLSKKL